MRIIIEADVDNETAERIQDYLVDPDKEPDGGFAFHSGHGWNTAIDPTSVRFLP